MKKLLQILLFVFAFTMSANAQEKRELTPAEKAKQNVLELSKAIDTNGDDQFFVNMNNLFLAKHEGLAKEGITEAEKKEIYSNMDLKMRATFSENQIKQIMQQPGLYDRLIKN